MAKSKGKFNPKDLLIKKGEYIALGIAGVSLLVLLIWGVSMWSDSKDPTATAGELNAKAADVQTRIQSHKGDPGPLEPWLVGSNVYTPVPVGGFDANKTWFDPIDRPDTKRENPVVMGIGQYQVDLLRAPMMAYDILYDNEGRATIGVLSLDKKEKVNIEEMTKAAKQLKNDTKKPPRPRRVPVANPMLDPKKADRPMPGTPGAGFDANSRRADLKLTYIPLEELDKAVADHKVPAITIVPIRLAVIHAEFPLKSQIEEFKRALRQRKDQPLPPGMEPRFEGFDVQRKVSQIMPDGTVRLIQDFADYDYISKYIETVYSRKLADHFDSGYLPYFLRYEESMAMPLPELVPNFGTYPSINLPGVNSAIKKLIDAHKPEENASSLRDRLLGVGNTKNRLMPQTVENTGADAFAPSASIGLKPRRPGEKDGERRVEPKGPNDPALAPIEVDQLLIRFIDCDVKPGLQYEYQIRIRMENPNYKQDAFVAHPAYAGEDFKTLLSPWVQIEKPVNVPRESFLFAFDPATYRTQVSESFKGNRPLLDLLQAKPSQAVVEMEIWTEEVRTDAGGKREPVGTWVVAEMPVGRGEYIGRKQYLKLPLWSSEVRDYLLRETPDHVLKGRGTAKVEQPKGWLVDFTTRSILVDFDGGTVKTRIGNRTIDEECGTELLIVGYDGRLLVRDSTMDMADKEREVRSNSWLKWVTEVEKKRAPGPGAATDVNIFDRDKPKP